MKILAVVCVCVVIFHLASAQTKTCSPGSDVKNGICTPCQPGRFQSKTIPITDTTTRCEYRTKCNASEGGYQIKEGSATEDNHCWCNESMRYVPRNPKACKDPENRTSSSCVCINCHEECVVTKDENGDYLERYKCTVCDSVTTAVPPILTPSPVSSGHVAIGVAVSIGIFAILCIVFGIILYVRGGRTTTSAMSGTSSATHHDTTDSGVRDGKPSYSRQPSAVALLCGESNGEITELFKIKLRELCSDKHIEAHFCDLLQKVGANWKFLVRPDLEDIDIQALEHDHRGLKEIVYQAIRQWYEKMSGESVQFVLDRLERENVGKGDLADKIRKDSVLMRTLEEIYARKSSKKGSRTGTMRSGFCMKRLQTVLDSLSLRKGNAVNEVTSNGSQATGDLSVNDRHDDRGIPSVPPPDVNPSSRPSRAAGDMIEYENSPRPGYKSSHPSINEVKIGEEGKGDGIGDMIEYENLPRPGYKSSHPSINEVKIGEEGKGDGIGDMIEYENSPRPGSRSLHSSMNEVKTGEEGKGDGIANQGANQSWEEEETRQAPEPSSSNTHREGKEIYTSGDGAEYELIRTPGDGDCFFRSCVRGLNEDLFNSAKGMDNYCQNPKDREKEHHLVLDIRNRTVDHMQEDNVHYEKILKSLKTSIRQGRDFLREHSIEMSTGEAEGVEDRSGIFTDEHYRNLETEIKDMRKPGVYATHLEVEALAYVEDVVIHVFQMTDGQKIQEIHCFGKEPEKKKDIYLMYRPTDSGRSGHYDLLCRVKNSYDLE
ncbi:uncharacterized protein LOC106155781 isoform X2 [Lingula anatina]|uniref:Uncharacterized protein LOC106155781 isoform X2 n=1 Tax=Lingula anatina TaxID=7574 RepID=A0A1S3HJD2_LINAN|nr:uncharacterized protein LOC106155781 isoform X2 [Lingula anatina]|eukprot:XP_013386228.1 uncharacterized protein LOC106155781 isoform X2 [Lingula anatina]